MVVIDYVLNGPNGAVQIALVEPAVAPMAGEIPQLVFGARQPFAIAMPEMPHPIAAVQIFMHTVNQRGNRFRTKTATGRPKLRLRRAGQREETHTHD